MNLAESPVPGAGPPEVRGKFLWSGNSKLYLRGVTYGTFAHDGERGPYPEREVVRRDFELMAERGINAVRTYTAPPRWLLDIAEDVGIWVAVGLAWGQHVAFLDDRRQVSRILQRARDDVRSLAGHPALLCVLIGNEIPQEVARWHGPRAIEQFLRRLTSLVRDEAPNALVSYVNYPTTEYLDLSFCDFLSFNVYLESEEALGAYLLRLQTLADERPLVLMEIGLDSQRHGVEEQARSLASQIGTVFGAGAAGAFVFAWTDEWHRGGQEILDWDFGLVDRARNPKPALKAIADAYSSVPFPRDRDWPCISVVVCSFNGERTIRDTLEGLRDLDYPDYEVIVVNDGSVDRTPDIASEFEVRLISTENRGLSNARNTGAQDAVGEIVAYIDDDAWPDPHWLHYLANTYMTGTHAGVGGPNLPPPGDGHIADCVSNAPGGPTQVLITDEIAEHVPGCNMSFRRDALLGIGGFDPGLRVAGDDVDVCWRIQDTGATIGFSPAAMVWHHRRGTVRGYWKQQVGYGRAEGLLEAKWPEKYNAAGYHPWQGRVYGGGVVPLLGLSGGRIYHGVWGSAPFQSVYQPARGLWSSLPLMPEWYAITVALGLVGLLGLSWAPLLLAFPLAIGAQLVTFLHAIRGSMRARFSTPNLNRTSRLRLHAITAVLFLIQPLARLRGRLEYGLTPWRQRGSTRLVAPLPTTSTAWSEQWHEPAAYREMLREGLQESGAIVSVGDEHERWDFEVRGGLLGSSHVVVSVEEHGGGKQLVRTRSWPSVAPQPLVGIAALAMGAALAYRSGARVAPVALALGAAALATRSLFEAAASTATAVRGVERFKRAVEAPPCEAHLERDELDPTALDPTASGDIVDAEQSDSIGDAEIVTRSST